MDQMIGKFPFPIPLSVVDALFNVTEVNPAVMYSSCQSSILRFLPEDPCNTR